MMKKSLGFTEIMLLFFYVLCYMLYQKHLILSVTLNNHFQKVFLGMTCLIMKVLIDFAAVYFQNDF